ncbi:PREDICTED: uncharacterized protein LOC109466869 [Branchiostoma belcheri]|uniref:Uncharacterized protein LOC109466869 n=1 Tax=Branchiostoma belcheri TaxID=7741 RepID=A0A6P4YNK9_BRABE|nr:PREDICTED: uncharacterized protein LOC109466869 [Branchiostoma belcheri]
MELRQTDQRQRRQRRTSESIPSLPDKTEVLGAAIDVVVSKVVRHDWRELGRKLGLEQVDIEATFEKHRGDPTECCREVLELWRRSNGAQATLQKLGETLRKAHHVDVAELIECEIPDSRAPRDVEVVETTESWIKIKWKPPATCVDAQPIGYMVDLRLARTDKWLNAHNRHYLTTTEFKVCEGITKKGQYYFRVRSVYLGDILSEPADSPLGIAKIQGQPDEPRNLRVTDLDTENNTVTLEWLEPEDDGGYPITSYIVEKSSGNEWERCLETSELHCKIDDIKPGCRLRVSAKNSEGLQSDPLDMVDPELRVRLDVEEADESIKKAAERAIWKSVYLPQGLSGKTIEEGSIVFVYSCSDLLGLWEFWIMYWQGQVEQYFQKLLITKDVLRACAATNVKVGVTIDPEDFHASCNHLLLTRPIEHGYRVLADPKTTDRLIGSVVLSSGLTDRLSSITGITTMQGIGHELADTYKASTSTRGYVQTHHLFRRTKKNRSLLTTAKLTVEHKHGYLQRRKFIPGTEVPGVP